MSIPSAGVGSLSTLLKRLEAATSRLEDIALAQAPTASELNLVNGAPSASTAAVRNSTAIAPPATLHSSPAMNEAVKGFEEIIEVGLTKYVNLSKQIGGLVAEQVSP
jgi:adenylyl cyclase-associated protein